MTEGEGPKGIVNKITDLINSGELYTVTSDVTTTYLRRLHEAKAIGAAQEEFPYLDTTIEEWKKLQEIIESGFDGYKVRRLAGEGDYYKITLTPADKIRNHPVTRQLIVDLYGAPVDEVYLTLTRRIGASPLTKSPDKILRTWNYELEMILANSRFDRTAAKPVFEELSGFLLRFRSNGELEAYPTKYDGLSRYIAVDSPIEFNVKFKNDAQRLEQSVRRLGLLSQD